MSIILSLILGISVNGELVCSCAVDMGQSTLSPVVQGDIVPSTQCKYTIQLRLRPGGRYSRVESIWEDLECFLVHPIVVNYYNILYCRPLYHVF